MNFSAASPGRKWPIAALGRGKGYIKGYKGAKAAMVTAVAGLAVWSVLGTPAVAAHRSHPGLFGDLFGDGPVRLRGSAHSAQPVPLPQPRPAEAPSVQPQAPASAKAAPAAPEKPGGPAAAATPTPTPVPSASPAPAPQPSACRLALTEEVAIAPSIPDIHGPGGCGGEDLVRLEAVVLPDRRRVSLKPAATMRCGMATAIADWVRGDIEPIAEGLGSQLADLDNYDSYDCRGRNGVAGALLSEHGRANALDVRGWKLANGQSINLTDRNVPRDLREGVLHSVCARFATVLGPGSDGYHEDHIHLDLMERHNNYKICQWNVWDPMPQIAPLMPADRPAEAPPRELAAREGADGHAEGSEPKPDAKPEETAKPQGSEKAKPDDAQQPDSQATKFNSGKSSKTNTSTTNTSTTESDAKKSSASQSESSKLDSSKSRSDKPQPNEPATKKRRQDRRS